MVAPITTWFSQGSAHAGEVRFSIKNLFFDRTVVERAVDQATLDVLRHAGGSVAQIAQRSMRYVTERREQLRQIEDGKRKRITATAVSKPGQPPKAVQPHPWIRKNLFFGFDPGNRTVVVGPVRLPGVRFGDAPHTLEFGGQAVIRNKRRTIRHVGSGGEVRIGSPFCRTTHLATDQNGQTVMVTYARLETQAQADRANRLQEDLYGPIAKIRHVDARPFMKPALEAGAKDLPPMWSQSVKAG